MNSNGQRSYATNEGKHRSVAEKVKCCLRLDQIVKSTSYAALVRLEMGREVGMFASAGSFLPYRMQGELATSRHNLPCKAQEEFSFAVGGCQVSRGNFVPVVTIS